MNKNWNLEINKDLIIKEYNENIKIEELSKKFDCCKATIYKFLYRNGIEKRNRRIYKIKYNLNENYFEYINTEEKAYWLGFLMADGNISLGKGNKKYLRIELAKKDLIHLEKFLICIQSYSPIKYRYKKNTYYFRINQKICNDLCKLGCIPKKTFNLNFPNLEDKFINHFVRGYFDGDGCITKKNNRFNSFECFFLGQPQFLRCLNHHINTLGIYRNYTKHPIGNVYQLSIYKKEEILKLKKWLYNESSIYLERKYNKFLEVKL